MRTDKKLIVLGACFLLLLWIGCASAFTLVASKTSPACTSGDEYFTSIQAAVDNAKEGDEIIVCPGTYKENIEVDKSVCIRSYAGTADTVIEAKNSGKDIANIRANKVSISGFTIRNSVGDGIYLDAVEGCTISRNNIYSTRIGIYLLSSTNNKISHNTVNLNDHSGIYLLSSTNNKIRHNTVNLNDNSGIILKSSNDNLIVNNTANLNKQYHGIDLSASNNNIIIGNNASNNFQSGIALFESSNNNTITSNIANSNNDEGIYMQNSHSNSILNNTANSKKQYHGIELYSSNNNIIMGNNASNNFQSGIALFESSNNNTIKGNTANSNKQNHGIELHSSNDNVIETNNASKNYWSGIHLSYSSNNSIKNNAIDSNILVGIHLDKLNNNNNSIQENSIFNNLKGILLEISSNNIITNNTLKSTETNIGVKQSSNNNFIGNNVALGSYFGIYVESNNNIIINNILQSNRYAICLSESDNDIIEKNVVINNSFGFGLWNSEYNIIKSNIMRLNLLGFQIYGNNNIIKENIILEGYNGIELGLSDDNIIEGNIIKANRHIGVTIYKSSKKNLIMDNIISSNRYYGISFGNTTENTLYHNDIIGNNYQVRIGDNESLNNNWYHPYLLEGNYWSDYEGIDIDGDGIGDTDIPHPEDQYIEYDNYPYVNKSGWLTFLVSPEYWDFGEVYQGEIVQKTFDMQNTFVYNMGRDDLNIPSITSEPDVSIAGMKLPISIPKGSSKTFNVTIDTSLLDGYILRSIEISSDDRITPNKTILIYGVVKQPRHAVRIKHTKYQSRIIQGQINIFNVSIENTGDFREENISIEIKEEDKTRDSTKIEIIEPEQVKSAIVKWNTESVLPGIHNITLRVMSEAKESLAELTVKVTVLAPSKAKTFIVTNLERLKGIEDNLIELSHHPSVNGIILNVGKGRRCSEAYTLWDSHPNSENANNVAKAIKDLIDETLEVYKNIEYLLIVGNDEVIPFYRMQDKSLESYIGSYGLYDEKDYIEEYKQLTLTTTIGSAFNENKFLTDDFYANFEVEDLPEGIESVFYIPDKPVGRLVETPEEIRKTIDVFSKKGDIVEPQRIFVTSYDFMNDTGGSCASVLGPLGTLTFMGKGIEEHGTYSDTSEIINELLNESNNVIAIFQHADHYEFDIAESHDFVTSNIISNSSADLDGSIVYTMSCHAGLNVPEDEKFNYDLAQAFMGKGVLAYVAPTGWGIGGVVTEAGHERLLHYFTKHLCEGMDAGTALMHAKQDYYAFDFDFDYIDQKVVLTTVLYGLPMYGVNVEAKTEGLMKAMSMEKPCNTFTFRPDYSEIETPVGAYSSVDETLSSPGKPVLPKLIWPYLMDGKMLHGITLKNARYALLENTALPYEEYVVSIAGGYKQPLVTGETWNPSEFFKVSTIGKRQYIILITGQFKKTGWTIKEGQKVNRGDLRRYSELTFDLHLSAPADEKNPPAITVSYVNASCITVNATDESGIEKLVMAYTDNTGNWESFDLEPDAVACTLEEEIELEAGKEYFVQAVDIYGNVAVDDNEGRYYLEKGGGLGPS